MKVKKSVKIIMFIAILIVIYLISKFMLFNNYSKYKENVVHLSELGTVLENKIFYEIRYTKAIYLNDELYIGNNFKSIVKEEDGWKITDDNKISYTLKVKEETKDDYKDYIEMISNINNINNEKYSFLTPTSKLKKSLKISKNIYNKLPQYKEIFLVDGNKKHGYIYKVDNEINAVIFVGDKKYHITIDNSELDYEYVVNTLSTLFIED